jgi:hypothetical protein
MSFGTLYGGGVSGNGSPYAPQPQNASAIGQDRLVRKEVSLGAIREMEPPQNHIGLTLAPFLEVAADDVVFDYLTVQTDGLAPARAEDAESELAQKDETAAGQGRASVIDWSLKDHYDASDVNRARELSRIVEAMRNGSLPLTVSSAMEDWAAKVARDRAKRRRKLDNRIEWLIMTAISSGLISYDDGKIKFAVDYGRPAAQQGGNAANDLAPAGIVDGVFDMSTTTFDPIRFVNEVNEFMFETYGVRCDRVIGSRKAFNAFVNSDKFNQRAGLGYAPQGGNAQAAPDPLYLLDGWGPSAARRVVENTTGVNLIEYDSVYRTRAKGSNTVVSTRFMPQNRLVFLPAAADLGEIDDTQIGFAKTLTSPHPEGNWTPGFYEWEQATKDPWGQDMGNGVKAFPVFPHMEFTYAVDVVLPS